MSIEVLRDIIEQRLGIPALPGIVLGLNKIVQAPDAGPKDVAIELQKDPALSAQVLKLANSSAYGLRASIQTIDHASSVLGMKALQGMIAQASILSIYRDTNMKSPFDFDGLWRHCVVCAHLSVRLACIARIPGVVLVPDELYTCGLLHDLGKIVLANSIGESYVRLVEQCHLHRPLWRAEQETLGFNHSDVGALVALRWRLPEAVVSSIQEHHATSGQGSMSAEARVVHIADRTAHCILEGTIDDSRYLYPRVKFLLGITPSEYKQAIEWGMGMARAIAV